MTRDEILTYFYFKNSMRYYVLHFCVLNTQYNIKFPRKCLVLNFEYIDFIVINRRNKEVMNVNGMDLILNRLGTITCIDWN